MQIVIIGNGFDLATGLPTKYIDYFEYFNNMNSKLFEELHKLITEDVFVKNNQDSIYSYHDLDSGQIDNYVKRISVNSVIDNFLDKNVSIWNLYFWFQGNEELKDYNWSHVEAQISKVLEFNDHESPLYFPDNYLVSSADIGIEISKNIWENLSPFHPQLPLGSRRIPSKKLSLNEQQKIGIIMHLLLLKRYSVNAKDKYEILKSELQLLEEDFKQYIKVIYEKNILNNQGRLKTYRNNLSRLIDYEDTDCYILNFNYTDLSSNKKSSNFSYDRNKVSYRVLQNNVHGVYYDKIIFGIDQQYIETTDSRFYFSKTYRKLETIFINKTLGLPDKDEVKLISFYGHSLSEADYSYFQSIFDYYDLYGSHVKLRFYYSNYKQTGNTRSETTKNIFNLLENFANSMYSSNKGMGKNLLHKLILEDRIKVEEIVLKRIN